MLYPDTDFFYPAKTLHLVTTQTIQLTCYLRSAIFSCVYFIIQIRWRLSGQKSLD